MRWLTSGDRRTSARLLVAGLAVLVLLQVILCLHFARFALVDDAFIAFRYVRNLLLGHGLVFNPGDRTEGYTCFLWIVLLAVPTKLGVSPVLASQVMGAAFLAGTVVILPRLGPARPESPAWPRLIAPALLASNGTCALWGVHGLETTMFMFLLTVAIRADLDAHDAPTLRAGAAGLWYGLAALTRPEGTLVFAASFCFWAASRPREVLRWPLWRHALHAAAVLVPFEIWRLAYYGDLLPNTFHAKVGLSLPILERGLQYLFVYFADLRSLVLLPALAVLVVLRRDRRLAFLAWLAVTFLVVIVLEGGDVFPGWRFLVPILPVCYLLVAAGSQDLVARVASRLPAAPVRRAAGLAAGLLALVAVAAHARSNFQAARQEAVENGAFSRDMIFVGLCLRQHLPPTARIALNPVGAVPYYSRLYAYDMLGLTDRHIARVSVANMGGGTAGHEKGDGNYILDQRPDLILFGNVMIAPAGPLTFARVAWHPMFRTEQELAANPRTAALYAPDHLPLADGRHLVFLRRRDFVMPSPAASP